MIQMSAGVRNWFSSDVICCFHYLDTAERPVKGFLFIINTYMSQYWNNMEQHPHLSLATRIQPAFQNKDPAPKSRTSEAWMIGNEDYVLF
jgi:hypothetical protein